MCVLLKGGSDARILCPMLIFKNKASSYPMQNLPDKISGVCYRTSPSAFINGRLMCEWLREPRCWGPGGPFASSRVLWMDNASGHCGDGVGDTARELGTKVKLFPANATDKVQPADRFLIMVEVFFKTSHLNTLYLLTTVHLRVRPNGTSREETTTIMGARGGDATATALLPRTQGP
ncbi:hypothetical protein PR003_g15549 [Phytophthora rubi]|uniref:DDE-1 domain-containing protein n=1 Tax=Phytophthora rubi TaxID=129364 RepID=A0A6A3LF14_9STRA|nr:hypothetical protein PR001_g15067 [Phytophthora rubi]KAE9329461.1 hypothetical protein PR003_g15549 [Phytophthora rubi]